MDKLAFSSLEFPHLLGYTDIALAEQSLYAFVKQAWPIVEGRRVFVGGWHIQAICEHLEAVIKGDIKRLVINVPPRTSKSTVASVMFCAWAWISRPELRFLYASHKQELATVHSVLCRNLILSPWYQERWADRFQLVKGEIQKEKFQNDQRGERLTTGVTSGLLGTGGDILLADDPNTGEDVTSKAEREKKIAWFQHSFSTRLNDPKSGCIVVIQQRLHENDITGYLISNDLYKEYVKLILPMEFEPARRARTIILPTSHGKVWQDPRKTAGELLCPDRIGPKELNRLKNQLGTELNISGQLQQSPHPEGGAYIKADWFQWWVSKSVPKLIRIFQSLDTAYTDKAENDACAITTWGLFYHEKLNCRCLLLLDTWSDRVLYPKLRRIVTAGYHDYRSHHRKVQPHSAYKTDTLIIETKAAGAPILQDLHEAGLHVHEFNPGKMDKVGRVSLCSALLENGLIFVPADPKTDFKTLLPISAQLIDQCIRFPNSEHDDIVDTMTQMLIYAQQNHILDHRDNPKFTEDFGQPTSIGLYNDYTL